MKTCNNCNDAKLPNSVPYQVLVDFKETAKANSFRWFIVCLVLVVLLVGSNLAWLIYESQFEEITETYQEVIQEAENGENHFVGGDIIGETNNKD